METERARVERAVAAGNPLWLIEDGILDDENTTGREKDELIAYAREIAS